MLLRSMLHASTQHIICCYAACYMFLLSMLHVAIQHVTCFVFTIQLAEWQIAAQHAYYVACYIIYSACYLFLRSMLRIATQYVSCCYAACYMLLCSMLYVYVSCSPYNLQLTAQHAYYVECCVFFVLRNR